jgi:hypothetical protein
MLKEKSIDLPIEKVIVTRTSYIDYPDLLFGLSIIDKRNWLTGWKSSKKIWHL